MKKMLITLLLAGGCSPALVERLSSERYTGREPAPFTHESVVQAEHDRFGNASGKLGVTKLFTLTNPLDTAIEAFVSCATLYQADFTLTVKPHTSRWQFIGANNSQEHRDTCFLMRWTPVK